MDIKSHSAFILKNFKLCVLGFNYCFQDTIMRLIGLSKFGLHFSQDPVWHIVRQFVHPSKKNVLIIAILRSLIVRFFNIFAVVFTQNIDAYMIKRSLFNININRLIYFLKIRKHINPIFSASLILKSTYFKTIIKKFNF